MDKNVILTEYHNYYKTEYNDIVSLANKLGWTEYELVANPFLFLHIVFEYLDIIN